MIDWQNIIEACRRADSRAERKLFDRYGEMCFRRAYQYLGSTAEAQDVVGTTFIKVFRGLPGTEFADLAKFEGWLMKIVSNESLMILRKQRAEAKTRTRSYSTVLTSEPPAVLARIEVNELANEIERLPSGYRKVMKLFAIEGYSHAEIGKRLNITEGTSRSQLSKARNLLKKQLKSRGYD